MLQFILWFENLLFQYDFSLMKFLFRQYNIQLQTHHLILYHIPLSLPFPFDEFSLLVPEVSTTRWLSWLCCLFWPFWLFLVNQVSDINAHNGKFWNFFANTTFLQTIRFTFSVRLQKSLNLSLKRLNFEWIFRQ